MDRPVTAAQAARALDISPQTVRRDVARGCSGIVRPGEPGRGRGALLDLDAYRAWREGRTSDDRRALRIAAALAQRTWHAHGGSSPQLRAHSARLLAVYIAQLHLALGAEVPEETLTLLAVSVDSSNHSRNRS